MKCNPMLLTDFYKISHRIMAEKGIEKTYSTFTPRGSRIKDIDEVVCFGLQGFIKEYLIEYFNDNFFNRDKKEVVNEYKRIIKYTLGDNCADTQHIELLHELGYLPIKIRALKEGTVVPVKIPTFTIECTNNEFHWLTNFLETLTSASNWKVITSTTIVKKYREICDKWADKTCDSNNHVQWQCHNFSYRGMSGNEDAITTGAGHLLFFTGTDTIPSICYLEKYYNANVEKELVGASVLASEHGIQCQYQDDLKYYKRLINEVAPEGIISIVSDGYDYWNVIGNIIPTLKEDIMKRNGKVVPRPDSGDPIDIICGNVVIENLTDNKYCKNIELCKTWMKDKLVRKIENETPHGECGDDETEGIFEYQGKYYKIIIEIEWNRHDKQYYYIDGSSTKYCGEVELTLEQKGSIESLWETFGGTINSKGYKVLNPHIGLIYGEAIHTERAEIIFDRLEKKKFSSENIVFGIGSYSLGYYTRDTFNIAIKSTHVVINGEEKNIFKDPVTDKDKFKKSQTGRVIVVKEDNNKLKYVDGLTIAQQKQYKDIDLLEDVFIDGKLLRDESLSEIRKRVLSNK